MKWMAPSEKAQGWMIAPIVVSMALLALPFVLAMVFVSWVERKLRPSQDWHKWFAWRPVPLCGWWEHVGKPGGWAWLESVERRARPYDWPTEYRAIPAGETEGGK